MVSPNAVPLPLGFARACTVLHLGNDHTISPSAPIDLLWRTKGEYHIAITTWKSVQDLSLAETGKNGNALHFLGMGRLGHLKVLRLRQNLKNRHRSGRWFDPG